MSNLEDWYEGLQVFKGSLPTANIGGGAANSLLVQTGPGVTGFVTPPTSPNTFLEWDGSNFGYASISANTRTASLTLYQWASSAPTSFPSGTSVYTWQTGVYTLPGTPNGWSLLPGTPVAGQTLYACSVRYVDTTTDLTSTISWTTTTSYAVGSAGYDGVSGLTGVLTNDNFTLPASNLGVVSSYTNSGTEIHVYDGATELTYDGYGLSTGRWKVIASGVNITPGSIVDSGDYATVNIASAMSNSSLTASITFTISGVNLSGAMFSFTKTQTFTKAVAGDPGSSGSTMNILPDRPTTFTSTDGTLDAGQSNITLTANMTNLTTPTVVWTFTGFQTSPTNSGLANQIITPAQFGTSKSATVTCTVNGIYIDTITIVRLEKSTAAAGATKNTIYNQTTAPTGGSYTTGDLWIDTDSNPTTVAQWQGSSWVIVSTYTNNTSQLTDGAGLGTTSTWTGVTGTGKPADNATKNIVTYSSTAPSSPVNGDIWVDTSTSPYSAKVRVSGAWQVASNLTTNTNQLTDGAGLGTTATWSNVSGSGKPADNATVGATFGTNISGQITSSNYKTFVTYGAFTAVGFSQNLSATSTSQSASITITHDGQPVILIASTSFFSSLNNTVANAYDNCIGSLSSSSSGTLISGTMAQLAALQYTPMVANSAFQYMITAPAGTTATYTATVTYGTTGNGTSNTSAPYGCVANTSLMAMVLKR